MAFDFPASPAEGSTFTPPGGPQYIWNAPTWKVNTAAPPIPPGDYVLKAGDQMSGNLAIRAAWAGLSLQKIADAQSTQIVTYSPGGALRWVISPGNNTAETGGNTGSNFGLDYYNDAGVHLGTAFSVARSSGTVTFHAALPELPALNSSTANQAVRHAWMEQRASEWAAYHAGLRVAKTGDTMTGALQINTTLGVSGAASVGGTFVVSGTTTLAGNLWVTSQIQSNTGNLILGGAGGAVYLRPSGATSDVGQMYVDTAGGVYTGGRFVAPYHVSNAWAYGGFNCKNGASGDTGPNVFNMIWDGSSGYMGLWVDNTGLGGIMTTSDYRIKKDVEPLPSMWETLKKYRPIKYTHQEWWPEPVADGKTRDGAVQSIVEPLFQSDSVERWGFIAHELQEATIDSAATGAKDQVNILQSPNEWTMLAAIVKTLQEAMERIEALENPT